MEVVVCGVPFGEPCAEEALRQVKAHGFTSVQIYTFWKDLEPREGHFDWSVYDPQVEMIRRAGLRYVPFLLMGPKYAAPAWWLAHPDHVGLVCLEHGKESPIESIWNAAFRPRITRTLEAFAEHYGPWDVLESIQPGICGDYGEAIFPVTGNWPGDYHTHGGFWCAGKDAVASFDAFVKAKYPHCGDRNDAWDSFWPFEEYGPFRRHRVPNNQAWLDQVDWYRASMTEYSEFWMAECRRIFPDLPCYLCTGGMEEPHHGSSFASQARVAAAHGGGIRLTNEGNRFYGNFCVTAYTWSACRHYGAYLGLEPVGPMTEKGVRARVFGSAAYGNRQIFHYYGNVFGPDATPLPATRALADYPAIGGERAAEDGIGFFWPCDRAALAGGMPADVDRALTFVRSEAPVSPISEELIRDGALSRFRCLVMVGADIVRRPILQAIARWVKEDGGLLLCACRPVDVANKPVTEFDACFGIMPDSEEACGITEYRPTAPADFAAVAALAPFYTGSGWMDLHAEAEGLICTTPSGNYSGTRTLKTACLFRRKWPSGGQGIYYCGPMNFTPDPEDLFTDPGVIRAVLADLCRLSGTDPLGLQPGEVARARVDGRTLVLTDEAITGA
ncbi:MAG: beta-galactosidase [Armatimonadetes bacterium]|nr:beta-galactosidase [Armatimonadota bacterium]